MILAGTNKAVAEWNARIQALNVNPIVVYDAKNEFDECDDPHGHIARMLTPAMLKKYESNQIPPNRLELKVGDICIVLRTLKLQENLATNTMVKILNFGDDVHQPSGKSIRIQVLNSSRTLLIPRIRFKCQLRYNKSYSLLRTQFPLRLAYSLTFNKSQGQTLDKVVMDLRSPVFSHGLLYVGNSRVRCSNDLLYLLNPGDILNGVPTTTNVVYKQLLLKPTIFAPAVPATNNDEPASSNVDSASTETLIELPSLSAFQSVFEAASDSDAFEDDDNDDESDPFGYYSNEGSSESDDY